VDDLVHRKPEATCLVAVATEWRTQQEALVETRIGSVLDDPRARDPNLQAFIPPTDGWAPMSVSRRRDLLPHPTTEPVQRAERPMDDLCAASV
jgi:hypothetical protein